MRWWKRLGARARDRLGWDIARTPTIRQMEAVECGAASLAMILAYHGAWIPLETLRVACGVSRDGSKASNVLKAARAFGMNAKGFRKEPEGLRDLPVPSIIHWNFNHYMVFEGSAAGYAYLNDPAAGRTRVTAAEFSDAFTGVVLAIEPTERFQRTARPPGPSARLLRLLQGSEASVLLIALFSLMLVLPGLVIPGLSRLFIDKVLLQQLSDWLEPLVLLMIAAALLQGGVTYLQQNYLVRLEAKIGSVLAARVLARMLALPLSFFAQRGAGELAGRIASADAIAALLSGRVATTAFNMIAVVVYAAAMAAFDPLIAMVAMLVPLLNFVTLRAIRRRVRVLNRGIALDQGRLGGAAISAIVGIETLKVSGGENEAFSRWSGYHARVVSGLQSLGLINSATSVAPPLLSALGTTAVLVVGGLRVIDGHLSVGMLLALQMLMESFTAPFNQLIELNEHVQKAQGDLNRIGDLLDAAPPEAERDRAARRLEGRIEMRNVSFGYSRTDPPLIENISLTLHPGMRLALVGGSGSGKSTIGRLLAGLLTPWSGEILFDGQPADALPPATRAASIAYVDQDVYLFSGSVRDNLTLWNPAIPEPPLIEALKDAEIYPEIAGRPGGLLSEVAEGGANFSGGQRQRLEIGRALAANPSILIMDEATAALDPMTELRIDQALRRRGCTCVIIAHRLSTIRDADEIVVLSRGKVVERGAHPDLITRDGAYAKLLGAST